MTSLADRAERRFPFRFPAGFVKDKMEPSGGGIPIHLPVPLCLFSQQRDLGVARGRGRPAPPCFRRDYISRRPSIAFHIVTSSANSMSLPTGMPMAMRVTFTPSGFSSFER
jgi:hypothetical protein